MTQWDPRFDRRVTRCDALRFVTVFGDSVTPPYRLQYLEGSRGIQTLYTTPINRPHHLHAHTDTDARRNLPINEGGYRTHFGIEIRIPMILSSSSLKSGCQIPGHFDPILAHKSWSRRSNILIQSSSPIRLPIRLLPISLRLMHVIDILSFSLSFLGSMVPYFSPSICFRAISPHVSLRSWKKHSNFFTVRRKSVLFHSRANTTTALTGKSVFVTYQIVPTSHSLT